MAMSMDPARGWDVSCSQNTQATVTTIAIGTQCAPMLLISASSQTEEEFSVLEVCNSQACASSQGGADIAAKAADFGNTGSFSNDSTEVQFGRKLQSCLSCQQCNYGAVHIEVGIRNMPNICTICKKVFRDKYGMDTHMRVHTGEKPYVCSICQKSFTQSAHLVTHEKLHSGERPYRCSICHKSFTRKAHLVTHERLHSGERPYVCGICQKSFTRKHNLVTHEILHSGEKPYMCSICHKSFTKRGSLVRHERLHSGGGPYECSMSEELYTKSQPGYS